MLMDLKQGCMAHGWGCLAVSFLVKDRLRLTTLSRGPQGRLQGRVFTSHAAPVLQAILHVEDFENIVQVLVTLKNEWARVRPLSAPLDTLVVQVHKDYHPALENARNTASAPLNLAIARAGSQLLTMTGEALNTELLKCGLLENMFCASTGHTMTCTRLSRVNAMFQALQYVLVRTAGMMPWPLHLDPVCTWPGFARYGGCEHVEFTKMLDLRLRPQTSNPQTLPVLRKKGRKAGNCLTRRGTMLKSKQKKAAPKSKPKAKAKAHRQSQQYVSE
jgi:hypothetical protein